MICHTYGPHGALQLCRMLAWSKQSLSMVSFLKAEEASVHANLADATDTANVMLAVQRLHVACC